MKWETRYIVLLPAGCSVGAGETKKREKPIVAYTLRGGDYHDESTEGQLLSERSRLIETVLATLKAFGPALPGLSS